MTTRNGPEAARLNPDPVPRPSAAERDDRALASPPRRAMSGVGLLAWLAAVLGAIALATVISYLLWRRDSRVMLEGHFIEWSQVAVLLGAAAVHTFRGIRWGGVADRLYRSGVALFCVSLALREIEIDLLTPFAVWSAVENALRAILVVGWAVLVWRSILKFGVLWAERWRLVFSMCTALSILACLLIASSWLFDNPVFDLESHVKLFMEETLELNGYLLFFVAAWTGLIDARDRSPRD